MKQLNKEIIKVIKYFSFFAYYPTSEEIYTFLQAKISKNSLDKELKKLVKQGKILDYRSWILDPGRYTVGEYGIRRKISNIKYQISKRKLDNWRYRIYIKLVSLFPQIRLIGLSGSISMMNAKEDDDIDLFIITAKNRLFTGRLIALILAQLSGLRRSRDSEKIAFSSSYHKKNNNETMKQLSNDFRNKVCLNLFFDEKNLKVPRFKQTVFVGHEVLQMKPIIIKGDIYEKFLKSNLWVEKIFPNSSWIKSKVKNQKSKIQVKSQNYLKNFLIFNLIFNFSLLTFNFVESIFRNIQLTLINRHRTTEIITSTQLWFHPNDFEKKIVRT